MPDLLPLLRERLAQAKIPTTHALWGKVKVLEAQDAYQKALTQNTEEGFLKCIQSIGKLQLDLPAAQKLSLAECAMKHGYNGALAYMCRPVPNPGLGCSGQPGLGWGMQADIATKMATSPTTLDIWLACDIDPMVVAGSGIFGYIQGQPLQRQAELLPIWLKLYADSKMKGRSLPAFPNYATPMCRAESNTPTIPQEAIIELLELTFETYGTKPSRNWREYAVIGMHEKLLDYLKKFEIAPESSFMYWAQANPRGKETCDRERVFAAYLLSQLEANPLLWRSFPNHAWIRLQRTPDILLKAYQARALAVGIPINAPNATDPQATRPLESLAVCEPATILNCLDYLPAEIWDELSPIWNTEINIRTREVRHTRLKSFLSRPGITARQWERARQQDLQREKSACRLLRRDVQRLEEGLPPKLSSTNMAVKNWKTKCGFIAQALALGLTDIAKWELAPFADDFPLWEEVISALPTTITQERFIDLLPLCPEHLRIPTFCCHGPRLTITESLFTAADQTLRPDWISTLTPHECAQLLSSAIAHSPDHAMRLLVQANYLHDYQQSGPKQRASWPQVDLLLQCSANERLDLLGVMLEHFPAEKFTALLDSLTPASLTPASHRFILGQLTEPQQQEWWRKFSTHTSDMKWINTLLEAHAHELGYEYPIASLNTLAEHDPARLSKLLQEGITVRDISPLTAMVASKLSLGTARERYNPLLLTLIERGADPFSIHRNAPIIDLLDTDHQILVLNTMITRESRFLQEAKHANPEVTHEPMVTELDLA